MTLTDSIQPQIPTSSSSRALQASGVCSVLMWGVQKHWMGWWVVCLKQSSASKERMLAEECPAPSHLSGAAQTPVGHSLLKVPWHQALAAHAVIPPLVGFPPLRSHFPLPPCIS